VPVDEVAQRIDLSTDSFVSAITGAGEVDPAVVEYLEQSATDLTLEALVAVPLDVERSLRELGELPDIPAVQGTTSEEEGEETSESELGLFEVEESTDDEFAAGDDLADVSSVRAAEVSDSDDEWSAVDSPTPVPGAWFAASVGVGGQPAASNGSGAVEARAHGGWPRR
jgi:hypothetical protein